MKAFEFKNAVLNAAKKKGIAIYDTHKNLIRSIENDLTSGKITENDIESRLKTHKDFRLGFTSAEYSEIKNKIR